ISLGVSGLSPRTSFATATAHTLAWALAANADFGIAPAMAASPTTWMPGTCRDSNVTGSVGHQPERSVTPAMVAMRPAFCGGITLATSALCLSKSVASVLVAGSTEATLPPADSDTHSIMGYSAFQASWNRRCLENASLASRMRIFERGFLFLRYQAIRLARS